MTRSPYKLLDYYRFEDADLFFGREEETRKMVGEILSSRLLVLFSPSGSGKTSLINAGVRPELEKMGYKTIYTRMERDPIPSVCQAVSEALNLPGCKEKEGLYEFLKKAAQAADQPLVIFLDQFEEFFIVFRDQLKLRQEFVRQVARIKYDDQLPVFLVLSLREDYFANLHEFRENIPSIFQNNANIRLEPFTAKAARRAIEEPLKNKDIEDGQWCFEKKLVDTILQDLKTEEGIEPIKLQLVCCTLWNQKPGDSKHIPLSTYETCGGAEKIFSNFTNDRLSKIPRRQHQLMVRIFESLKTPDNTKRYRPFEDLHSQLNIKKTQKLKKILKQLSNIDILRQEEHRSTSWYEFKHDYVVAEINKWIKERREGLNRKRMLYAVLPGIILFLSLFTYLFLQYNTFYAGFTNKDYDGQQEEIVISRGIDPFGERINTGIPIYDVKDLPTINELRSKIRIGFWNKNNWNNLAATLFVVESGEFLYKIGQMKLGSENLVDVLKKSKGIDRVYAAASLGRLGKADENVIDALIQALKDKAYSVRRQAAASLGRLGKRDKNIIKSLIQTLKDEDSIVRLRAAASLGRLGKADNTVIEVLIQALKNESSYVREQAADSLVRLGKGDNIVIDALLIALEDQNLLVRLGAADSLVKLGKAYATVIEVLLKALKDGYYDARRQAVASLGILGKADKTFIEAVLKALNDEYYSVRKQAAASLGILGKADKTVIEALIQALKDESSFVRGQAAASLGILGKADKTVIEALIQSLKDEYSFVRGQAATSLGILGKADKTVIEALIQSLKDEYSNGRFRPAASLVLLGKADETVIEALLQGLKDVDWAVRREAAASLLLLGKADKTVIEALLLALKDEDSDVREKAGDFLGNLWKKKSETELIELLKNKSSGYRTAAAYALKHKKSVSRKTLDEIIRLKDTDKRPWVRLGAWKAFELLQEKKEEEEKEDQGK